MAQFSDQIYDRESIFEWPTFKESKPEERRRVLRRNWLETVEGWPTHCIMFEPKVTGAKMCLARDFTAKKKQRLSALQNRLYQSSRLFSSKQLPKRDHNEGMEPLGASQLTQWKRACSVENTNQSINERLQRWQTRTSNAEAELAIDQHKSVRVVFLDEPFF
jgi:hypothetical protein